MWFCYLLGNCFSCLYVCTHVIPGQEDGTHDCFHWSHWLIMELQLRGLPGYHSGAVPSLGLRLFRSSVSSSCIYPSLSTEFPLWRRCLPPATTIRAAGHSTYFFCSTLGSHSRGFWGHWHWFWGPIWGPRGTNIYQRVPDSLSLSLTLPGICSFALDLLLEVYRCIWICLYKYGLYN